MKKPTAISHPRYDFFDFPLWERLFPGQPPPTVVELVAADRNTERKKVLFASPQCASSSRSA